ncbi:hypothetical protein IWZ03DRAFT_377838 [Phyllosticta citriasiana]|uniref:Secreted protein n=1 Tax=Phyllosticta citriasiana TaxID=595635 RepID=A0ABR1KLG0_9PEZI
MIRCRCRWVLVVVVVVTVPPRPRLLATSIQTSVSAPCLARRRSGLRCQNHSQTQNLKRSFPTPICSTGCTVSMSARTWVWVWERDASGP